MSAAKPRVVVTRRLPERVEAELAARFDAVLNPGDAQMDAAALAEAFAGADAVLCTVGDRIDAAALGEAPRAKMVATFSVGTNHIDLDACRAAGVRVSSTPGVLTDATADIAMSLILMIMRRCGEGERMIRAGEWHGWAPTQMLGRDPTGATLGIVGMGRIGRATARRAHYGFGMKILYANRSEVDPGMPAERRELEALMAEADVISVHAPASPENRNLISAELIGRMKPEAYLINTARGDVVDEPALIAALEAGKIAGAGLDVFAREPEVPDALRRLENVALLPHLGSATQATREAMGMKCVANLAAFFEGADLPDPVV
ncbi:D-glycerate dehydrogenase [Albimonas sp. CAU 1670]|uniref:2-hydroxyacid dehydrogenase n=1 Tax=Albimonas sp. CAU 1670 TaxID=3032599 RepID=UPI0023DC7F77|nr:D-glycerate dehydrogenase [Albimonas sp. CAU 1670]MDF2234528.1 D-glycerate dehydrogenase [Albimonas sp. CAU 1670]